MPNQPESRRGPVSGLAALVLFAEIVELSTSRRPPLIWIPPPPSPLVLIFEFCVTRTVPSYLDDGSLMLEARFGVAATISPAEATLTIIIRPPGAVRWPPVTVTPSGTEVGAPVLGLA